MYNWPDWNNYVLMLRNEWPCLFDAATTIQLCRQKSKVRACDDSAVLKWRKLIGRMSRPPSWSGKMLSGFDKAIIDQFWPTVECGRQSPANFCRSGIIVLLFNYAYPLTQCHKYCIKICYNYKKEELVKVSHICCYIIILTSRRIGIRLHIIFFTLLEV